MVWRGINWLKAKKLSIQQNAADVGKAMVIGGDGKLAPGVSGKVDSVNGIRPDTDKDVKTDYAYDNYNDYLADRANVPANAHVMIKNEFKDVYTGYMLVPDEINLEPTNRISDNHGMWIADRAGYIRCVIMADNAGGTGWLDSGISINGVDVAKQQFPNIPIRFFPPPILVKAGDRIVIWINPQNTTSLSNVSVACYFIPPVIVPIPQSRIVVQLGSDYSLTEQPVLINDGGTIRQKQDVDGKPIWCRTFTGNLTIPAGTWDYPILIPSGIEAVLGQDGWWNTGGGSRMPVEICENKKGVDDSVRCFFVLRKDADQSMIISTYSDVVRTNAPYRVYVEYTKV
jgi:hypothetical protein